MINLFLIDNAMNNLGNYSFFSFPLFTALMAASATGVGCLIHSIQLAVNEAILSQRTIADIIAKGMQNCWSFQTFIPS